jgi:hypothetical protein
LEKYTASFVQLCSVLKGNPLDSKVHLERFNFMIFHCKCFPEISPDLSSNSRQCRVISYRIMALHGVTAASSTAPAVGRRRCLQTAPWEPHIASHHPYNIIWCHCCFQYSTSCGTETMPLDSTMGTSPTAILSGLEPLLTLPFAAVRKVDSISDFSC